MATGLHHGLESNILQCSKCEKSLCSPGQHLVQLMMGSSRSKNPCAHVVSIMASLGQEAQCPQDKKHKGSVPPWSLCSSLSLHMVQSYQKPWQR